jgi:hypothetical protein
VIPGSDKPDEWLDWDDAVVLCPIPISSKVYGLAANTMNLRDRISGGCAGRRPYHPIDECDFTPIWNHAANATQWRATVWAR